MAGDHFIGIDVGTGSVRAGIFDASGACRGVAVQPIRMWRPAADFVEQSSDDIWRCAGQAVREAMGQGGLKPADIGGVGFDATCSLVVLGRDGRPMSVSPTGKPEQNVIVWMDHRAVAEADEINAAGHEVLRYVGGVISPEMETPKLLWLKRNMPETFKSAGLFLDLPDFLTWRATGVDVRSLCTTVCKWTYLGHETGGSADSVGRWDVSYFRQVGLGELADEGFARIGTRVRPMGEPIGQGLTGQAARELGLAPGTPVGVSIIDAHAGGLGLIGADLGEKGVTSHSYSADDPGEKIARDPFFLERRLALIGGTSSCHMAVSTDPKYVDGVWGPYYSAMIPGMWLTEGGQSATGALVDHTIFSHAQAGELANQADAAGKSVYELLNDRLAELAGGGKVARLTRQRHVLPYFHGNRSPRANPHLRGVAAGLRLDHSADDLAVSYLATIQAIACGTRHIVESLNASGYRIDTLLACGGGTKNPVFLQAHADATGCRVVLPREPEAVLLGSAILGAVAGGRFADIPAAMAAMTAADRVIEPDPDVRSFYESKFDVFLKMYDHWMELESLMDSAD